jgi:hypothetical protein
MTNESATSRVNVALWYRRGAVLCLCVLLAACGGSGGGSASNPPSSPPATVGPTADDVIKARSSDVALTFAAATQEVKISWRDAFDNETGYRVETRGASATWQTAEALPAAPVTGVPYTWARTIDQSATYRVVTDRGDYDVPLERLPGLSELPVDFSAISHPTIGLDQNEPVRETAQVSTVGVATARSVAYFIDGAAIATATTAPDFSVAWDTAGVTDGPHLLLATIELDTAVFVELRRGVDVDNPNVAVGVIEVFENPNGVWRFEATASSDVGIQRVEFFVGSQPIGIATSPSPSGSNHWSILFDTRTLPVGTAPLKVVAIDNLGDQAEQRRDILIDNAPILTLSSPADGRIVSAHGSLQLRGTVTDDVPGARVKAFLGDLLILETTDSAPATDYPLSGFPPREYTITVQVTDSAGHVVVERRSVVLTGTSFTYQFVDSYPEGTALLATDAGDLLYRLPNGPVRRRSATSTDIELEGSAELRPLAFTDSQGIGSWDMSGNFVTGVGSSTAPTIALYDASGTRQPVPPTSVDVFLRSFLEGPWFISGRQPINVTNLLTADVYTVNGQLFRGSAFSSAPGSEKLFFTRDTAAVGSSTVVDLFAYRLADSSVVQLSGGDARHLFPVADDTRVAWRRVAFSDSLDEVPFSLVVAPASNPTSATIKSTTTHRYDVKDGLLVWLEETSNALALQVDDGNSTETIASNASTKLFATSDGQVIFGENGKLYVWSKAGERQLLLDALPRQALLDDGIAFVVTGVAARTVHRVAL